MHGSAAMTDDIELPEPPRLQVPLIDADIDLMDVRRIAKWAEGIAKQYARAAVLADRERRAQPSAEPVAWMSWDGDVMDAMTKSAAMRTVGMSSSIAAKYDEPLYLHPPTDSAALRDAAIAELVRRKLVSAEPFGRCTITAAEIAAIAHHQAAGEEE